MKSAKLRTLICGLTLAFVAGQAVAQIAPPKPQDIEPPIVERTSGGEPSIPERPTVVPPIPPPTRAETPTAPERPVPANRPSPPQAVKDLVKDFQKARQEFLKGQRELEGRLKNATPEQRDAIRAQLKERLATWLEQQKARIQELRDQARDIKERVPISDVIDAGRGEGRGRGGR